MGVARGVAVCGKMFTWFLPRWCFFPGFLMFFGVAGNFGPTGCGFAGGLRGFPQAPGGAPTASNDPGIL